MSMLLMVQAMNVKVGNPIRKLILLKLADNANDNGECWPSYGYIAKHCECSKSAVISHIDELIAQGFLTKENRLGGEKGNKSNVYILNLENPIPPESTPLYREKVEGIPSESIGCTAKKYSPIPSESTRTYHIKPVIEPVIEPIKKINKKVLDLSGFEQQPSEQVWSDYLEHRKNKKAKLTQTALNQLIDEINKANELGITTDSILAECMLRNWQGFKSDWLSNSDPNIKQTKSSGYVSREERNKQAIANMEW